MTIILFALGQLGRMSFLNQQINVYLYELALCFTLVLFFLKYRLKPLQVKNKLLFVSFFISLLFSYIINLSSFYPIANAVALLYLLRLLMYGCFIVYLSCHRLCYRRSLFYLTATIIISGFLQYFLYPDLRNLFYSGWDPHLYRMFGTFFDTNIAGAVYGLLFFFTLINFPKGQMMIKTALLLLLTIAISLTFSRSLYAAFLVTLFIYFWRHKQLKIAIGMLVFFLFLIMVIPKPSGEGVNLGRWFSINARLQDDQAAFKIWSKQPVFGYGYNRIRYLKVDNPSEINHAAASFHSSFLIVLVTNGIIGLVLFLLVILRWFGGNNDASYYAIPIIIMSLFDNVLLHPFIIFLLSLMICCRQKRKVSPLFDK